MTTVHRQTRRLASTNAVAEAFEYLARYVRTGVVVACSLEWHPNHTARLTIVYSGEPDEPLILPAVSFEEDEDGAR